MPPPLLTFFFWRKQQGDWQSLYSLSRDSLGRHFQCCRLSDGSCAGMLLSSQFNINYFAISEVDQWWSDFVNEWTNIGTSRDHPNLACLVAS